MWVIIFLLFTLLFLLAYLDTRKPENFPPGPSWLPMLGSALEVDKFRQKFRLLALGIANISKSHGPILGVRIGRDVQVFLHGYEPIKQMLTEDVFDGRPIGPFYMERTFGKRRGILFTDQGFWQEQRRFVIKNLREFGFGRRDMGDAIAEEAQELVKSITNSMHDKNSVVLQVSNMFNISTINTLWSMLVGTRYDLENGELRHLQRIMADLFKKIDLVGCLFGQFPFLRYLAPERSGYNTYIKTHIPIWKFLTDEIENHKQNFKNGEAKDFVDKYLEELEASGEKTNFTELQLMAICMDLFMAGSETTSRTLEMFMLNILLNQDVQKKAQEEIDQVIGNNRMPLISDKINMPYVEAMVLETIRHISGRSFIVPHRALKDTTMEGYFIPKDTMVVANMMSIMLNPVYFEDPFKFDPDRFIKEGKVVIPEYFLTFGGGKRKCLGETLGKSSLFLFIASLLQRFSFTGVPGEELPDGEILDGISPAPKPFKVLATLR